ncbi:MAG: hypothetical protein PHF84_10870, partial [bacterium]|nr:hypothetical protein [bacterium]
MKKIIFIIIIAVFLTLDLSGQGDTAKTKEDQTAESDRIKLEIQDLVGRIKANNEKARSLFDEAKIKADSLKQEAGQKLDFLNEAIIKAGKSKSTDKAELDKAEILNKEAKRTFKEFQYSQTIDTVNKALGHISDIPVVSLTIAPQLFSPDESLKNVLTLTPDMFSLHKVTSWTLFIRKKEENDKEEVEVIRWEGSDLTTNTIEWDGKSDKKMVLDSASSYIAEMTVRDEKGGMGKSSQVKFKTDIFTTRTERGLLINISSIKFDYNKADLKT